MLWIALASMAASSPIVGQSNATGFQPEPATTARATGRVTILLLQGETIRWDRFGQDFALPAPRQSRISLPDGERADALVIEFQ